MTENQVERRKMVTIPQDEFEAMLERAAERGARHALHEVGLDGEDAAHDIRELRNLLDAFNEAKKTAGLTIIKMLVTGMVMACHKDALLIEIPGEAVISQDVLRHAVGDL